jgi:hypothetical protein
MLQYVFIGVGVIGAFVFCLALFFGRLIEKNERKSSNADT